MDFATNFTKVAIYYYYFL